MFRAERPILVSLPQGHDVPVETIWRLSVEQYHQMIDAGILTDDDPVELLEGWLVAWEPKSPRHSVATGLARCALGRFLTPDWFTDTHAPITTDDSEPEPDLSVIRGEPRDYLHHHPGPEDVPLVVEVADSSLPRDRGLKRQVYARAGVAAYWIVNLSDRRVEMYTEPTGPAEEPGYRQRRDYTSGDEVPVVIEGVEVGRIPVSELLP